MLELLYDAHMIEDDGFHKWAENKRNPLGYFKRCRVLDVRAFAGFWVLWRVRVWLGLKASGNPAQVLELLYDADVIEEDAFHKWAEEKRNADEEDRAFLARAAKFLQWLKEAEEEEEEEGEEDDDGDDEDE